MIHFPPIPILGIALSVGSTTTKFAPLFSFDNTSLFVEAVAKTFPPEDFTTTISFGGSAAGTVELGDVDGVVGVGAELVAGVVEGFVDGEEGIALAGAFSKYQAAANPS